MNFLDFKRLIRPITNKIFLLLGRAVLMAINNSEDTQKIQVIALADETISDIERFQEYGFETYPIPGAEAFIGFLNGNVLIGRGIQEVLIMKYRAGHNQMEKFGR